MNICSQIISFIIGFFTNLSVVILLIYWQFTKSIAGYRLDKVENATKSIVNEIQSTNSYTATLQNKYRYSLGVLINMLVRTFGAKDIPKTGSLYTCMLEQDGDGWSLFNFYVRPVIDDINNFSFIGWFTLLPKMKKLKTLINLCKQLENITAELDSIRLYAQSKGIDILLIQKGKKNTKIIKSDDACISA